MTGMEQPYSGPSSPWSPGRWLLVIIGAPLMLLAAIGFMGSYIIPSVPGEVLSLCCALVGSGLAALFAARDPSFDKNNSYFKSLSAAAAFVTDVRYRVAGFALLGFLVTFFAVERGALALWTLAANTRGERIVTVSSYYHPFRHRIFCTGLYLREAPFMLGPALCTDFYEATNRTAPRSGSKLRVLGKVSAMGIAPERFYEASALPDRTVR